MADKFNTPVDSKNSLNESFNRDSMNSDGSIRKDIPSSDNWSGQKSGQSTTETYQGGSIPASGDRSNLKSPLATDSSMNRP